VKVTGGYYPMTVIGGNCCDCTYKDVVLEFGTGPAMLWMARGSSGQNSSHWFDRVLFNQEWPGGTPNRGQFQEWKVGTAYNAGDVVEVGNYRYRCKEGGVSTKDPVPKFYFQDITDGPLVWRLVSHRAYRALHIDTGVSIVRTDRCDSTGPFMNAIDITNNLGGEDPWDIKINNHTSHGNIYSALCITAGREIKANWLNSYVGVGTPTRGVFMSNCDDVELTGSEIYGFDEAIYRSASATNVRILGGTLAGNQVGIRTADAHFLSRDVVFESMRRGRTVSPVLVG